MRSNFICYETYECVTKLFFRALNVGLMLSPHGVKWLMKSIGIKAESHGGSSKAFPNIKLQSNNKSVRHYTDKISENHLTS